MAFLIGGAIRLGVSAVKSGVQAHKDFNSPSGPEPRYDRHGNPKDPGPLYGAVMKAEAKYAHKKGKGKEGEMTHGGEAGGSGMVGQDTPGLAPRRSIDKSQYESEDHGPQNSNKAGEAFEAPPAYDESDEPSKRALPPSGFGDPVPLQYGSSATPYGVPTPYASNAVPPVVAGAAYRGHSRPQARRNSSSSSSSSNSGSGNAPRMMNGVMMDRRARKEARRAAKKERRGLKREHKAERREMRAEQRYERDMARAARRGA